MGIFRPILCWDKGYSSHTLPRSTLLSFIHGTKHQPTNLCPPIGHHPLFHSLYHTNSTLHLQRRIKFKANKPIQKQQQLMPKEKMTFISFAKCKLAKIRHGNEWRHIYTCTYLYKYYKRREENYFKGKTV